MDFLSAFFGFVFTVFGFLFAVIAFCFMHLVLFLFSIIAFFFTHLLLFLLVGLIWAGWCGYRWMSQASSELGGVVAVSRREVARRIQSLAEVSDFTDAVIALRVNTTLSAHEKLVALAKHYNAALTRLEVAGQLTPATALEFRLFAEQSAAALTGLTADFGAGLNHLIRSHE
jgi:hypothetical protein